MAKKQPYLPKDEPGLVLWLNNFNTKFQTTYAAMFGFTAQDIVNVDNDKKMWQYIVNIIAQNKTDMQEFTGYKDLLRKGPESESTANFPAFTGGGAVPTLVPADIFGRIGKIVQIIKNKSNYTTAIGEDLGIIGAESTFNPDTFKPTLTAKVFPGQVRLDFLKSQTDGVNIYAKDPSEVDWTFLALDTQSPYNDTRPLETPHQPEEREYRCRGVIDNVEIGLFSDAVMITFGG